MDLGWRVPEALVKSQHPTVGVLAHVITPTAGSEAGHHSRLSECWKPAGLCDTLWKIRKGGEGRH